MAKNTNTFKYLGSIVTEKGRNSRDISERIKRFIAIVGTLWPIIEEKQVPLEVERIILNTVLTPTLTYGSERLVMKSADRSRTQEAEMRQPRAMVGKTRRDRIRTEDIRKSVGVCSVLNKIDAGQLRWLGHLERMEEERVVRGCWEWMPGGRRPRGRPRKRWKETIEHTPSRHDLPNIRRLREEGILQDRTEWRKISAGSTDRRLKLTLGAEVRSK